MASRYYTEMPEKKITAPKASRPTRGGKGPTWGGREQASGYPDVGPHWKTSFNRSTKFDVVKTRPAKGGLD